MERSTPCSGRPRRFYAPDVRDYQRIPRNQNGRMTSLAFVDEVLASPMRNTCRAQCKIRNSTIDYDTSLEAQHASALTHLSAPRCASEAPPCTRHSYTGGSAGQIYRGADRARAPCRARSVRQLERRDRRSSRGRMPRAGMPSVLRGGGEIQSLRCGIT
jgi:hypothetical protein